MSKYEDQDDVELGRVGEFMVKIMWKLICVIWYVIEHVIKFYKKCKEVIYHV
jgi:hypothetical protein